MKSKLLIVSATLLGGFFSSAAFAATSDSNVVTGTIEAAGAKARFEVPAPVEVVSPTRLAAYQQGKTVDVLMIIDETGHAQNVRILSRHDDNLRKSLVGAMKQWHFKPASKNGTPVATKVILPVQLL